MRLDDRISAIFNEVSSLPKSKEQSDWLWRNFNKALVRAKKLENLAEATKACVEFDRKTDDNL